MSEQYFSVQHCLSISVIPMEPDFQLPDQQQFEAEIPESFKIANTIVDLDFSNSRMLRNISDEVGILVEVINQQAKKINLLMSHILMKEEDECCQHQTISFGGSHISFYSTLPLGKGQIVRLKIYLRDEACAVYCYAKIARIEEHEEKSVITAEYCLIQNDDREQLIRSCIYQQSRQLRDRAAQKYNLN